ncbi:MAG: ABC transporter substrate-binding protein, partial [Lachnospiraceae bacterium]|nr:ABC transporter substrate-binding protein [Lachnospiraceae bacterium]
IERGYFAEEGLDVNIRFPANENDAIALVSAGKADIGLYYEHDAIQAVADQGVHIKSIGAVVQSPLNVILSLADKNIKEPRDMAGKKIGYAGTALSEALVRTMLKANGEDPDNVDLINVGFELMSAMTTDQVDATIGCLVNHEVPQLEEEGFDVNYFLVNEYGIPNYYEAVFLANDETIENEPEVLAGFLRACAKGFDDFQEDPDACLQILLDNQSAENFPLSPTVEKKSCETLLPLMETADAPFLTQTEENWQENIDWMYEEGLITQKITPADVIADIPY